MADDNPETKPWHDGIAGADLGVLQNRGWAELDAAAAAKAMFPQLIAAESRLGVPASEVFRIPADPAADPSALDKIYAKLGKPAEAKDYDFSAIKFSDGTELTEPFVALMRDTAFKAHLPPAAAQDLTRAVVKFIDDSDKSAATEAAAVASAEAEKLKTSWAANYDNNVFLAQKGAERLGFSKEWLSAQANGADGAAVMERFRQAAVAMGEARFITGSAEGGNKPLSAEQAIARKREITTDPILVNRYLEGDRELRREMDDLDRMIVRARMGATG